MARFRTSVKVKSEGIEIGGWQVSIEEKRTHESTGDTLNLISSLSPKETSLWGAKMVQPNERPVHRAWVDTFGIARYPVTNREYKCFMEMTGHPPPRFWGESKFQHPDQPVVAPSWYDAVTYCKWLKDLIV